MLRGGMDATRWGRWAAALLAVLLVALAGAAQAATVRVLSPGAMADRSEVVFVAKVTAQSSRWVSEARHVVTDTTFTVEQTAKGSVPSVFVLTQLGGVVGEGAHRRGTAVPGYARFAEGERVVLFLERTDSGRLVPTGLSQGKYRVVDEGGTQWAVRELGDLHLVGNRPAKHLLGAPQDFNRMKLDDVLTIARGERPWHPVPLVREPTVPGGGEVAR